MVKFSSCWGFLVATMGFHARSISGRWNLSFVGTYRGVVGWFRASVVGWWRRCCGCLSLAVWLVLSEAGGSVGGFSVVFSLVLCWALSWVLVYLCFECMLLFVSPLAVEDSMYCFRVTCIWSFRSAFISCARYLCHPICLSKSKFLFLMWLGISFWE